MKKNLLAILFLAGIAVLQSCSSGGDNASSRKLILVTLDGMRWQEVFRGADSTLLLSKEFTKDTAGQYAKFWSADKAVRRERIFPFLWGTIAKNGQVYGNRDAGNKVNVTNQMWFSYPGYNELLSGAADDVNITSNDKNDNPNVTVLEHLNSLPNYQGKIAAFTSWDCFPAIINTKRNGILVNSGIATYDAAPENKIHSLLNEMTVQLPYLGGTRPDAITFHHALEYLKTNRPNFLYISFDETDHFAHSGEYDLYLKAAGYTDGFLKQLWDWAQSDPDYANNTTLLITSDHGRGPATDGLWQHHGRKVDGADQIWMAVIGPDVAPSGERTSEEQFFQNQVAATIAKLLGSEFKPEGKETGKPIETVFK